MEQVGVQTGRGLQFWGPNKSQVRSLKKKSQEVLHHHHELLLLPHPLKALPGQCVLSACTSSVAWCSKEVPLSPKILPWRWKVKKKSIVVSADKANLVEREEESHCFHFEPHWDRFDFSSSCSSNSVWFVLGWVERTRVENPRGR